MSDTHNFQPGDWVKFKSATRSHCKAALRKVVAVLPDGRPMVRYHGWPNFIVELPEVIGVQPCDCTCMEVFGEDPACKRHGVETAWGRANPEPVCE